MIHCQLCISHLITSEIVYEIDYELKVSLPGVVVPEKVFVPLLFQLSVWLVQAFSFPLRQV